MSENNTKAKPRIRQKLFIRTKVMHSDKAAPKGATIASQLKRIEAEANKCGILSFNIDSSVTSSPVAERVAGSDSIKSRLIVFQKKVSHEVVVRDLKGAGEYLLFGMIDALERVIELIKAGALEKRNFVIVIYLSGSKDGMHPGLRLWHNDSGVLGLRRIEFSDDYVHSGGRGALIGQELAE